MLTQNKIPCGWQWLCVVGCLLSGAPAFAITTDDPFQTGNFALSASQRPSPLIGFGQTLKAIGDTQLGLSTRYVNGVSQHVLTAAPQATFGVSNVLAVSLVAPYVVTSRQGVSQANGVADAAVNVEYAFYGSQGSNYHNSATVFTSVTGPTGSLAKVPATGVGASSVLLGVTLSRMYPDWFVYGAPGVLLTMMHSANRAGNQYLYQFGAGRNVLVGSKEWIVAIQAELDGYYTTRTIRHGVTNTNTGGNMVWLTPSVFVAGKHAVFKLGVGAPVAQHLNGHQQRNRYQVASVFAWTL